jgi:hypothetical protein
LHHSVNADANDETKLKVLSFEQAEAIPSPQIAFVQLPTLYSPKEAAKAFSRGTVR